MHLVWNSLLHFVSNHRFQLLKFLLQNKEAKAEIAQHLYCFPSCFWLFVLMYLPVTGRTLMIVTSKNNPEKTWGHRDSKQLVLRHFSKVLLACAAVEKNPDKPALRTLHMGGQFSEVTSNLFVSAHTQQGNVVYLKIGKRKKVSDTTMLNTLQETLRIAENITVLLEKFFLFFLLQQTTD